MAIAARRSSWAVPACLASALLLAACSTSASGSSNNVAKPPLVIGISMSLSGDFADMAKPALRGYQLWADTVNARGGLLGRKVDLKVVDDASNPTQAVTNYENLISADKVSLVFGPFSSLLTIPTATV